MKKNEAETIKQMVYDFFITDGNEVSSIDEIRAIVIEKLSNIEACIDSEVSCKKEAAVLKMLIGELLNGTWIVDSIPEYHDLIQDLLRDFKMFVNTLVTE